MGGWGLVFETPVPERATDRGLEDETPATRSLLGCLLAKTLSCCVWGDWLDPGPTQRQSHAASTGGQGGRRGSDSRRSPLFPSPWVRQAGAGVRDARRPEAEAASGVGGALAWPRCSVTCVMASAAQAGLRRLARRGRLPRRAGRPSTGRGRPSPRIRPPPPLLRRPAP